MRVSDFRFLLGILKKFQKKVNIPAEVASPEPERRMKNMRLVFLLLTVNADNEQLMD